MNNHNETGEARLNRMNVKIWDLHSKTRNMMREWKRGRRDGAREHEGEYRHDGLGKHE